MTSRLPSSLRNACSVLRSSTRIAALGTLAFGLGRLCSCDHALLFGPSTNNCGKAPQKGPEMCSWEASVCGQLWQVVIDLQQKRGYLIGHSPPCYPRGCVWIIFATG